MLPPATWNTIRPTVSGDASVFPIRTNATRFPDSFAAAQSSAAAPSFRLGATISSFPARIASCNEAPSPHHAVEAPPSPAGKGAGDGDGGGDGGTSTSRTTRPDRPAPQSSPSNPMHTAYDMIVKKSRD